MNFKELISKLRIHRAYGNLNVPVKGIAYDSRRVLKDFVFVAIRGFSTDGHKYIKQALDNGACALVVEKPIQNLNVPWVQVDNTRMALAEISAAFYGYPCNEMEIIGITGTNGKTTTAFLMNAVLKNLGYKTGLIGTIYNIIGEEMFESINTTPESLNLQHMLSEMSSKGIRHVTMEVSSHALSLYRTHGISFKAAIFTNLSQDHLDFHSDMNEYASAKAKLFEAASLCVINRDDAWASQMIDASKGDVITYGIYNDADVMAKNIKIDSQGISFDVTGKYGNKNIKMKLTGKFNVYNALAAFSASMACGYEVEKVIDALEKVSTIPGRFELIKKGQPFAVVVDYAHTPDGLLNILLAAKNIVKNRLIAVFGCGGDRDASKRPVMGEIAAKHCDMVVITSDNPRTEKPSDIIEDIVEGVVRVKKQKEVWYEVIENRKQAISYAIKNAKPGDVVIIAGKGHETYQIIGNTKHEFDDRKVAYDVLSEMGYQ